MNSVSNSLWVSQTVWWDKTYRNHPFSAKSTAEWRTDCRSLQNKFRGCTGWGWSEKKPERISRKLQTAN